MTVNNHSLGRSPRGLKIIGSTRFHPRPPDPSKRLRISQPWTGWAQLHCAKRGSVYNEDDLLPYDKEKKR